MSLPLILIVVLGVSALLMVGLHFVYASHLSDSIKLYEGGGKRLTRARLLRNVVPNSLFSGVLTVGCYWGMRDILFEPGGSLLGVLGETIAVIGLYDLLYYCLHRFLFHEWELMRGVHIVHHTVKYPTTAESLYVHPVENALGVLLLVACVAVVGPISLASFAIVLAIHSILNVLIHSGLRFRARLLRPITFMVDKHARHHASMRAGNYASITPLPDILFGTSD